MTTHLLLLRGVNVGGHHKLPMASFRDLLTGLGYAGVRTYIQSGNAVLDAPPGADVGTQVEAALQAAMGWAVPVIVFTPAELRAAVAANPFEPHPKRLHLGFLPRLPDPARVQAMDPDRGGVDRYAVVGRVVYILYEEGSARSKLTAPWFDRQLDTTVTARNWRTVGSLVEMAGE
jgi:uncharacterized protein (DUF1697 family)